MNPHSYAHLNFNKGTKNTMEKRQLLQQMLLGRAGGVAKVVEQMLLGN
jgi:hypothetical protein